MKLLSNTFCAMPWASLNTYPDGRLKVCCNAIPTAKSQNVITRDDGTPYKIYDQDVENFWNSEKLKTMRAQMLNNERPDLCTNCYKQEDLGIKSSRLYKSNDLADDYVSSDTPPIKLRYIDLRLGNLCNLKCRMCSPVSSNIWNDDWKLIYPHYQKSNTINWQDDERYLNLLLKYADHIQELYISGGEPTLATSQYKIFDRLIEINKAKNVTLFYNINCTNLPEKMVEYWGHFKRVKISASVDAYGDLIRYIRHPTGWQLVEKTLLKLKHLANTSNVNLCISPTIQIYNVMHLNKLFDFLLDNNIVDSDHIYCSMLIDPEELSVHTLPHELKLIAEKRLEPYMHIEEINKIVRYMYKEDLFNTRFEEFKRYTKILDASRNENLLSVVPEFSPYF